MPAWFFCRIFKILLTTLQGPWFLTKQSSDKIPCWYEQHIYETVCHMTMSHTSEIWIFEVIFVVFRLIKNIIFNKTESFVGKNTLAHACQIFCSKSNCETMYHWFFLLEITVVKIMNNLNVCSAHSYLYPRAIYTHGLGLRIAVTYSRETRSEFYKHNKGLGR